MNKTLMILLYCAGIAACIHALLHPTIENGKTGNLALIVFIGVAIIDKLAGKKR